MRIFLFTLLALLLLFHIASAATSARMDNCTFVVAVNVSFTGDINQTKAESWKNLVLSRFNQSFKVGGECRNCLMRMELNYWIVPGCSAAQPGSHCITVEPEDPANPFRRSTVTVGAGSPSSWWKGSMIPSGTGNWSSGDPDNVIIHEFGNLLGLDDEYTDVPHVAVFARLANGTVTGFHRDGSIGGSFPLLVPTADYSAWANSNIPPAGGSWKPNIDTDGSMRKYIIPVPANTTSIMAGIGGSRTVDSAHAQKVFDATSLECPKRCCCGDGKVNCGEGCDPAAIPTGCSIGQVCSRNCTCENIIRPLACYELAKKPELNYSIQCDPTATHTGCLEGQQCTQDCKCIWITGSKNGNVTRAVRIVQPKNGSKVRDDRIEFRTELTGVKTFSSAFLKFGTFITDISGTLKNFTYFTSGMAAGSYGVWVQVNLLDGTHLSDYIVLIIDRCGDGLCETKGGEDCENCAQDCGCGYGQLCLPFAGDSDNKGCIYHSPGSSCGNGVCDSGEDCVSCSSDCWCSSGYCVPTDSAANSTGCVAQ